MTQQGTTTALDRSTISQRQLAKALGIDKGHVSRIFAGTRIPSAPLLHDMAKVLGTTMDALYEFLYPEGSRQVRLSRAAETRQPDGKTPDQKQNQKQNMKVKDDTFDRFVDACEDAQEPNKALRDAAGQVRRSRAAKPKQ